MDVSRILIASAGAGMGAEMMRRYRHFKQSRRNMPAWQRNEGFWTDGRVKAAEIAFFLLFPAPVIAVILFVIASNWI